MDRVELSVEDIDRLLEWRDQHVSLVRTMPAPLKAVEIVFKHNDYRIKGIRDGTWLKLYIAKGYDSLGHFEGEIIDGKLHIRKGKLKINEESFQDCLTCYASLMALMVYGERPVIEEPEVMERKPHTQRKKTEAKPRKRTTYILRSINGSLLAMPKGSHASPSGVFTVRGHYRHYKSGKVVWIDSYRKGTGKKKRKTYRIGGKENVRDQSEISRPAVGDHRHSEQRERSS